MFTKDQIDTLAADFDLEGRGRSEFDYQGFASALLAKASAPGLSDREIADTVNKVRDIALQFHATQQLRERIARVLVPILTRASAATVGEASKLDLTGDRLTEEKAAHIMQRDGYAVTGYVLAQPDGRRCIVEKSAVRWLTKDEAWNLMHPSEAAQQQAEPSAACHLRTTHQCMCPEHDCEVINPLAAKQQSEPVREADYCTESNCRRCNTPKALRTPDMDHAGLGEKPKAAQQQGEPLVTDHSADTNKMVQQAEPGADEPFAWTTEDGREPISDELKRARLDLYGKHYTVALYRAAQSGQRAGVPSHTADAVVAAIEPWLKPDLGADQTHQLCEAIQHSVADTLGGQHGGAEEDDGRPEFEAWVTNDYGIPTDRYPMGGYVRTELNMWWATWKASRTARKQKKGG